MVVPIKPVWKVAYVEICLLVAGNCCLKMLHINVYRIYHELSNSSKFGRADMQGMVNLKMYLKFFSVFSFFFYTLDFCCRLHKVINISNSFLGEYIVLERGSWTENWLISVSVFHEMIFWVMFDHFCSKISKKTCKFQKNHGSPYRYSFLQLFFLEGLQLIGTSH